MINVKHRLKGRYHHDRHPSGRRWRRGEDDRDREREEKREDARTSMRGEQLFREERLPVLKWGKARDAHDFGGDKMAALRSMTSLVKSNLDHKLARQWLDEIVSLAKGEVPGEEAEAEPSSVVEAAPEPEEGDGLLVSPEPAVADPNESGFEVK